MRRDDRDPGGENDQDDERDDGDAAEGAPAQPPPERSRRAAGAPERRDTERDEDDAGDTREHGGHVVAADAVDGDVADAVRGAAGDGEGAGEDRQPASHDGAQARRDRDQQRRCGQRDQPAGEVVPGGDAGLRVNESVVGDRERDHGERGPEDGDVVARRRRRALAAGGRARARLAELEQFRHGLPGRQARTASRDAARRCGSARRVP